MPKFKFDSDKLEKILGEYAELRSVEIPKAVLINGRLLAKELMRRTQPFGIRQESGEKRVEYDIRRVIKDGDHLERMADKVQAERIKNQLKSLIRSGRFDAVKIIFERIGFLRKYGDMEIVSDHKRPHSANRNPRTGRTGSRGDVLYVSQSGLKNYVEETARRVGLSKAGWAEAAEALPSAVGRGNTYDFPQWVKRNTGKGNGSAQDKTSNASNPTVVLTNSTPWIDRICPATEQIKARSIVIARMKKQMEAILKKRKKASESA
jgi:hypothetical protein